MTTIKHSTLIQIAKEEFAAVTELAASHRPGCIAARAKLRKAAKHGLADRAYLIREGMCYGWGPSGVEPLFGTETVPIPLAERVRASEARKLAAGARKLSPMIINRDAASALDRLMAIGYAGSVTGCIARALVDAVSGWAADPES